MVSSVSVKKKVVLRLPNASYVTQGRWLRNKPIINEEGDTTATPRRFFTRKRKSGYQIETDGTDTLQ
jgi:hypothetical protein